MTASALRGVVIGAGPAGIYATQALLRRYPAMHVDLLDRLPVPFGLVRYGVSPDHPSTKNAISQFSSFISSNRDRVSFYGNVPAGPGTALPDDALTELYHVAVSATGAKAPRTLPNVQMPPSGVHSAHDFARWANGHPELDPVRRDDLEERIACGGDVAIIGVGNVAIDVARMLLRSPDDLRDTDVSPRALDVLEKANVRSVTLVGRKNPARAAWSTAALREIVTKIPGVVTACNHRLVQDDLNAEGVSRTTKRALKLLAERTVDEEGGSAMREANENEKLLRLQFLRSPQSFTLLPNGNVGMDLESRDQRNRNQFGIKGEYKAIFLSLGYCPSSGSGYRVGWANGKATGIIGDNKWDAESVVSAMPDVDSPGQKPGLSEWLRDAAREVVTWEGWGRIDDEERSRGQVAGRQTGKIKLETLSEMLQVAGGPSPR